MIRPATIGFSNGNEVEVERAKIKESGWVAVYLDDGWVYYPPRQIDRIVSRRGSDE